MNPVKGSFHTSTPAKVATHRLSTSDVGPGDFSTYIVITDCSCGWLLSSCIPQTPQLQMAFLGFPELSIAPVNSQFTCSHKPWHTKYREEDQCFVRVRQFCFVFLLFCFVYLFIYLLFYIWDLVWFGFLITKKWKTIWVEVKFFFLHAAKVMQPLSSCCAMSLFKIEQLARQENLFP